MIRFRNPGTSFSTIVRILKILYQNLKRQNSFNLKDITDILTQENMMTAYGFTGKQALLLSDKKQSGLNSTLMNAKMSAEVLRMLGWITPEQQDRSYPIIFTYIGKHVATSTHNTTNLFEQSIFGIVNPNELTDGISYTEHIRFFKTVLRCFIELDDIMYKHELCIGPMSINDNNESEYLLMLENIKTIRSSGYNSLQNTFSDFSESLGMATTSVDNCTRLPIALLKSCGLVESIKSSDLYNKNLNCLRITGHGRRSFEILSKMKDLRLNEFHNYSSDRKNALIRLGIYSMLARAGYDMEPVREIMQKDSLLCEDILQGKDLLFSPYQTIRHEQIDEAMGFNSEIDRDNVTDNISSRKPILESNLFSSNGLVTDCKLNIKTSINQSLFTQREELEIISHIKDEIKTNNNKNLVINNLFASYKTAKIDVFYPLISTLFKIIGLNCLPSRKGDNGARWDAMIIDDSRSIPIEIKSPTEEEFISIKAIQQAVENKIILMSRKTYKTTKNVTTLAVGYRLPNQRAEVNRLIYDFKETFGIKVGIIDLHTLITIAITIIMDKVGFDIEILFNLDGTLNATT